MEFLKIQKTYIRRLKMFFTLYRSDVHARIDYRLATTLKIKTER